MNYTELIEKVLQEYQENSSDIEYCQRKNGEGRMLLVSNWDDIHEINNMFGQALLEAGETTQDEFDACVADKYGIMYVEKVGLAWGFTDEFVICDYCNQIVPRFEHYCNNVVIINESDWMCSECARENVDDYIDFLLEKPTERANEFLEDEDLQKAGFTRLEEEYENGLYDRVDNPDKIYAELKEKYGKIIFSITTQNPYAKEFVAWVKDKKE